MFIVGCSDQEWVYYKSLSTVNNVSSNYTYNITYNLTQNVTINETNPVINFTARKVSNDVNHTICLLNDSCFTTGFVDSSQSYGVDDVYLYLSLILFILMSLSLMRLIFSCVLCIMKRLL